MHRDIISDYIFYTVTHLGQIKIFALLFPTDAITYQVKIISRFKISNEKIFKMEFYHFWDEKNMIITAYYN